jgi:hypothetical protein
MVTIVWNPHGFYLIDALPKVQTFNEICYVNIILRSLLEHRSSWPGACLMIHADNTKPHTARKTLNFSGKSPGNRATSTILAELRAS